MSISERLQMVIKMKSMTNASFADKIGVQRSSISHVLAGRNKPSIDFIQKILVAFPNVNADWLITGKNIGIKVNSEENERVKPVDNTIETLEGGKEVNAINNKLAMAEKEELGLNSEVYKEKRISKIVVFYNDGTFEETIPNLHFSKSKS